MRASGARRPGQGRCAAARVPCLEPVPFTGAPLGWHGPRSVPSPRGNPQAGQRPRASNRATSPTFWDGDCPKRAAGGIASLVGKSPWSSVQAGLAPAAGRCVRARALLSSARVHSQIPGFPDVRAEGSPRPVRGFRRVGSRLMAVSGAVRHSPSRTGWSRPNVASRSTPAARIRPYERSQTAQLTTRTSRRVGRVTRLIRAVHGHHGRTLTEVGPRRTGRGF